MVVAFVVGWRVCPGQALIVFGFGTRDQGTISPYRGGRFVPWSDDEWCLLVVCWLSLVQIVATVRFLGVCGRGVCWLSLGRECLLVSFAAVIVV